MSVVPERILLIHNTYRQPGGEDSVFRAEARLLLDHGHKVWEYTRSNHELQQLSGVRAAMEALWSRRTFNELTNLLQNAAPDLAHFHNTFARISPAAYHACKRLGIPTVQTLHNYRLTCPAATHVRNGRVCEDCLGRYFAWPSIIHRCYRGSAVQSGTVAIMNALHAGIGTWQTAVDFYIALTPFMRNIMLRAGLPADRVVVKPNFLSNDPGVGTGPGDYALFVGRLVQEKGIETLLDAWSAEDLPSLKIIGDGPLERKVQRMIASQSNARVKALGRLPHSEVLEFMKSALVLIFPSEWYEGFPMAILEAMACGIPVLASKLGSLPEIVEEGKTGLLFTPGNIEELRQNVRWIMQHPEEIMSMGINGRMKYLETYSAAQNYRQLIDIYRQAIFNNESQRATAR
ncbi:MAG: glycosyltransferase [Anaerolineales bacterium]|nr:glycosyltransferase [Anaerolineales bacterium]